MTASRRPSRLVSSLPWFARRISRRLAPGWILMFTTLVQGQPTITTEPADQSVSLDATVRFKALARASSGALSFAWWFRDAPLDPVAHPTAVRSTLVLSNVTEALAGVYHVVVADDHGAVTSRVARLEVDPSFTKISKGALVTDAEGSVSATWIDYDEDGFLDLFVGNASSDWSLVSNSLYRNNRDGSFTKMTAHPLSTTPGFAWGVGWGDADDDGKPDLFVANAGNNPDQLFHNDGAGQFTRVMRGSLVTNRLDSLMPLWGDYDGDGWLDLFLSTGYWRGRQSDRLYHNGADGQFLEVPATVAGELVSYNALSLATGAVDYDRDGDLDLFVAYTDTSGLRATNFVFRSAGNGSFERQPMPVFDVAGQSWGVAWGDYDNDGYPDVFMPSWMGTNALFHNVEGQGFADVSEAAGLRLAMASNDAGWADYDNDGWLDLFVGNYLGLANYPGGNALFVNQRDGTFLRVTSGSPAHDTGRCCGLAWGDYDNNGYLDCYLACGDGVGEPNLLYHNNGSGNHWLKVQLRGATSNRLGLGAKIRVQAHIRGQTLWQMRTITAQQSWVGGDGLVAHFGLGDATVANVVRVEWPSGNVQELTNQAVDLVLKITEPARIQPARPSASLGGAVILTNSISTGTRQWRFNGADLAGETNRTLSLTNIHLAQEGRYSVVIMAGDGTVTTNFAYLLVDAQFTKITEGPVVTERGNSGWAGWGDFDEDGYADLAVGRYQLGTNAVYHNMGDGSFERVTNGPLVHSHDVFSTWGDWNNDGGLDLMVARQDEGTLLYFRVGPELLNPTSIGLETMDWWGCAMADYDRDGDVDLFFSNVLKTRNRLYRNEGDTSFVLLTANEVGQPVNVGSWGGPCWDDFDDDGWPDLYVPSFRTSRSLLFRNTRLGGFTPVTNVVTGTSGPAIAGAWGDYDNDGRMDLCVACLWGGTTTIYRNLGDGEFEHPAGAPSMAGNENFAAWGDYDNDGFLDLFLSGYMSGNKLLHNNGDGSFTRITLGSIVNDHPLDGAGTYTGVWFDYDNDGFLDLHVLNGDDNFSINTANLLYHNNGNTNSWLTVKLVGTVSNRSGTGAKVRASATFAGRKRWQRRDITAGDIYNGNNLYAHFGLGNASKADVLRIEWPSGIVQELSNVAANQILTVTEPVTLEALGEGRIRILCWKRQNYEVEVSDDLDHWTSLGIVAADLNRPVVLDPDAAGHPHRFYRAKGP